MRYLLAVILGLLFVSGCSQSPQEGYLEQVREKYPALEDVPDKTLTEYASSVCTSLDAAPEPRKALDRLADLVAKSEDPDMFAYMAGSSVAYICPEHRPLFE